MDKGKITIEFEADNRGYFFCLMQKYIEKFQIPADKSSINFEIKSIKVSYPRIDK